MLIIIKYMILVSLDEVSVTAMMIDYLGLITLAGVCYLAVFNHREKVNEGKITFQDAFMICIYISFIAAILVGCFQFIYAKYIDPTRAERMVQKTIDYMKERKMSENDMKRAVENARAFYQPVSQFITGISVIIYGLFISLVIAALTKKDITKNHNTN